MVKKIFFAFIFCISYLVPYTAFSQANSYFHDRIDTTIFGVADTVGHGVNNYYVTNTSPDFNIKQYVNGLTVTLFIRSGNTGTATLTLITRTGTLSTRSMRKATGMVLASGDIKDSSTVLLIYYNGSFRLGDLTPASVTSWMLTGNSGTTAGTNFIGTTDSIDFVFKTNNRERGRFNRNGGSLTLGATSVTQGKLNLKGITSGSVVVTCAAAAGNWTLTLPTDDGTTSQFLQTDGNGVTSWQTVASPTTTCWSLTGNSGTTAGTNFIGTTDSIDFVFKTNNRERGRFNRNGGSLTLGATSVTQGKLDLKGLTSGSVVVTSAAAAGSWTLTLPTDDGTASQFLQTDGNGITSWQTVPSATTTAWGLLGNAGTTAGTNFLGTTDAQALVFKTSNTEAGRISTGQLWGLGTGTTTPTAKLQVVGTGSTSATSFFKGQNSGGSVFMDARNDGSFNFGVSNSDIFDYAFGTDASEGLVIGKRNTSQAVMSNRYFLLNGSASGGELAMYDASGNISQFITNTSGGITGFNRVNADIDFNVEGTTDQFLFYADASAQTIGIGTTPSSLTKLKVVGNNTLTTTYGLTVHNSTGTSNTLMVRDDARVGIGTSTPAGRVNIQGAGTTTGIAFAVDNNTPTRLLTVTDNGNFYLEPTQTSVNNSVSGTTKFAQPQCGGTYKVVIVTTAAATGTASYTFPVPFVITPSVVSSNLLLAAVVTSLSTTAVTITGAASTGSLMLIGY